MTPAETPRFLTARDVSRCLGLTKSTVYDWIAHGSLPCHRFGRTIRVAKTDLEAYLARSRMNVLATARELEAQRDLGLLLSPTESLVEVVGEHRIRTGPDQFQETLK